MAYSGARGGATITLRALAGSTALALTLLAAPCMAQQGSSGAEQAQGTQQFNIPAQSLTTAVTAFGDQAGLQVTVDGAILTGLSSQSVVGRFSPAEALSRLLGGTGITYRWVDSRSVALERAPQSADGTVQLGPVRVEGQTGSGGSGYVSTTTDPIATEGTRSYTAPGVSMFRGTQSLKETPQSATVITRQLMDDLNLNTVEDVLRRTPGITLQDSPMGGSYFYSRGFNMLGQYQYDGVPIDIGSTYNQASSFGADMGYLDRVEVLRGASGMMKGAGTPAGGVNFVRKRGPHEAEMTVALQAGSWQNYRAQLDVGGPLNASGTLRARTVLALQDREFFYDLGERGDQLAYAALDYDISPSTTLGVGIAYERLKAVPCFGGLNRYSDGSETRLPRSTCLGASWNRWKSERTTGYVDFRHQFNDDWSLKIGAVYSQNDQYIKYATVLGVTLTPGSTSSAITSLSGLFDYDQTDYGADAYIDGKFRALGGDHQIIFGANFSHRRAVDQYALIWLPELQNVFNPIHNFAEPADSYYAPNAYRGNAIPGRTSITQKGVYANLRLDVAEGLKAVLGGRLSWFDRNSESRDFGSLSITKMKEHGRFTPFAALLYDITGSLTAYASYADIFKPQSNIDPEGNVIPPETGANYEIGIKGEWMNGALNASLNLFRADLNHSAAAVDNSLCKASTTCSIDTGHVRAEGFEAEVTGSPIDRMQVTLGYTYTKTKILSSLRNTSVAGLDGNIYNSILPRHVFRGWIDYDLGGKLNRWSIGAGVTAQSEIYQASGAVRFTQGAYALVSARVAYDVNDNWNIALNGNNIFDKSYYRTILGTNYYGEPRSFMLTLRGKY